MYAIFCHIFSILYILNKIPLLPEFSEEYSGITIIVKKRVI